jgi:hypothetical protein
MELNLVHDIHHMVVQIRQKHLFFFLFYVKILLLEQDKGLI